MARKHSGASRICIAILAVAVIGVAFYVLPSGARATTMHIEPSIVLQGDPVMVVVTGTTTAGITGGTIGAAKLDFFDYSDGARALYGLDLDRRAGTTTVMVAFSDGTIATSSFFVNKRARPHEALPIPEQIGGNSYENQQRIVSILQTENADLAKMRGAQGSPLFMQGDDEPFVYPVRATDDAPLFVTNKYGYDRDSGAEVIAHKGVDFRAASGTPVYAIGNGTVLAAKEYIVYGDSVIIDHGAGIVSMYMHLSKMAVAPGQRIEKGELIGYSGDSGYSEGSHLHLTVRIGGISIDPMRFFSLFGKRP